jgi:hypothetical protein
MEQELYNLPINFLSTLYGEGPYGGAEVYSSKSSNSYNPATSNTSVPFISPTINKKLSNGVSQQTPTIIGQATKNITGSDLAVVIIGLVISITAFTLLIFTLLKRKNRSKLPPNINILN